MMIKDKLLFLKNSIMDNYRNKPMHLLIITFIVIITATKFSLIKTGFMTFPDEFRFMAAGKVLDDIAKLDFSSACNAIFSTKSKPGDVILSTIPNAIQQLTGYISDTYCYESSNSYPLFIFNFIVYIFILIIHFKLSKLILKNSFLALVSVLLLSTLTNSYLYLRHVLAYDTSILIFYIFIYKTIKYTNADKLSFKKSTLYGVITFFAYLVYPGYFPLFFLVAFLFFFNNINKKNLMQKFYHSCYFALGSIYCLGIFEIMSRYGNVSYIDDAIHASEIVNQGSAEESYSFIVKYLFEVEGIPGILLLSGVFVFAALLIYKVARGKYKENRIIILLGSALIGMYLIYASVGYFFSYFILMGRSLHEYLPFMCTFMVLGVNALLVKITTKNKAALLFISLIFVIGFALKFNEYYSISYPRDVFWELSKNNDLKDVETVCEYPYGWSVTPGEVEYLFYLPTHKKTYPNSKPHLITNGCFYYPVSDYTLFKPFVPGTNLHLLYTRTHYINFKAYQYEGHNISERENIRKMNFQIKVFAKK